MSNFKFQRGDVYLIEEHSSVGSEQKKTRPWVVMSATSINKARRTVIGIPFSLSAKENPPLAITIYLNGASSRVLIDQIRVLDKSRFIRFEGQVIDHDMAIISKSLKKILMIE